MTPNMVVCCLLLVTMTCVMSLRAKDTGGDSAGVFCPSGWITKRYRCFIVLRCHNTKCSWHDAKRRCKDMGGSLARTFSVEDDEFLGSITPKDVKALFIGARDVTTKRKLAWDDWTPITYTNWNKGEPNNYNDVEDCVELSLQKHQGKWNDVSCTNKYGAIVAFACEQPAGVSK